MAGGDASPVSRSKSWKGVMRNKSRRMGGGNGVGESKRNIFRAAWTLLREGGNKRNNVDATSKSSREVTTTISNDDSSKRRQGRSISRRGDRDRIRRSQSIQERGSGGIGGLFAFRSGNIRDRPREGFDSTSPVRVGSLKPIPSQRISRKSDVDVKSVNKSSGGRGNGAETDSPSSGSSGDSAKDGAAMRNRSAGAASTAAAASPVASPPSYETLFPPRRTAAAKAAAADKEPERKTKTGSFGISRKSRSSSAHHVMMGTSSARQRASGSMNRTLASAGASSVGAGAGATQGLQTSVANKSILRAASGESMSPLDEVYHVAPRRSKVAVSTVEKMFIRSLEEVNPEDFEVQPSSPLLGPERMRHHTSARNGEGFKKTLVLDLDETLISSRRTPCNCDYKIVFKVHYQEATEASGTFAANADAPMAADDADPGSSAKEMVREIRYYVRLRPGLTKFLEKTSALYELVVWTASGKSYADAILDLLDPEGKYFSKRLYRESCVRHKGLCVKDLRCLGRPMDSVVLLDNYVYSFGFTLDNGVPIAPWTGDEDAKESGLMMAYSLLKHIARVPDIRVSLITAFNLHKSIHGKRPPLAPVSATPHLSSGSGFGSVFASSPAAVNSSIMVAGS